MPDPLPVVAAPRWQWWIPTLLLMAAAAVAYLPTLDNDFVTWDDPKYISNNPQIPDPHGLASIWHPRQEDHQYYPLVFTTFWLEYRLWEFNPRGYHLTNLILHALSVGLLVAVLRLLGVSPWVAWLAAGLWALHPINCASVAWATQRKNTLSGLFYLLSLICYLRNLRHTSWPVYVVGLAFFVLGLLSKTAIVTLPATALLCERLVTRRWSWQGVARVAPLFVLGFAAGLITVMVEQGVAKSSTIRLDALLRPLVAGGSVWFYIGKILVPFGFPGVYPRWDVRASWLILSLAMLGVPLAALLLWRLRHKLSGHVLWGLSHYVLALGPMLGLIHLNYNQTSFVADHFVYIPALGVFLTLAVALDYFRRRTKMAWLRTGVSTALMCAVLAGLGYLTNRQAATAWKDAQSFWENTVRLNPGTWTGQYNLGNLYSRAGRYEDAVEHYRLSTDARPDLHHAWGARAKMLHRLGRLEEAEEIYREAIRRAEVKFTKWTTYQHALATILTKLDRPDEAEACLRRVIDEKPFIAEAHLRLARHLHTRGQPEEAIPHYQEALRRDPNLTAARQGLKAAQQR